SRLSSSSSLYMACSLRVLRVSRLLRRGLGLLRNGLRPLRVRFSFRIKLREPDREILLILVDLVGEAVLLQREPAVGLVALCLDALVLDALVGCIRVGLGFDFEL